MPITAWLNDRLLQMKQLQKCSELASLSQQQRGLPHVVFTTCILIGFLVLTFRLKIKKKCKKSFKQMLRELNSESKETTNVSFDMSDMSSWIFQRKNQILPTHHTLLERGFAGGFFLLKGSFSVPLLPSACSDLEGFCLTM